ncbi:uncharacterized protein NPIL_177421 [Nephila pilipes]|uniref:Uncharacterized protein n=1 Tax=Nephila pilipes TaxID=299642 RepID=A0A8X6KJP9_NEPPI|nr:uncharacterized protein NPIL_177421 [Nephila pilipes]
MLLWKCMRASETENLTVIEITMTQYSYIDILKGNLHQMQKNGCNRKHNEPVFIHHYIERKLANLLKYIAGKNWVTNAATLRLTYLTLIRSILEYGFPIYCCASNSVLKKLEQVQLSAACIITGLKHSCPSNIFLFEADVRPLLFRRQTGLVKYFNKLSSFDQQNQTSKYLNNWVNGQRLKKNSPFIQVEPENFLTGEVEPSSLQCSLNPSAPPTHHWYADNRPGLALALKSDRCSETALSRLASGPIKCLSFSANQKISLCPRCQDHQASPEHMMRCMDLSSKDIYTTPLLMLDFLRVNDLIDLV